MITTIGLVMIKALGDPVLLFLPFIVYIPTVIFAALYWIITGDRTGWQRNWFLGFVFGWLPLIFLCLGMFAM
nr:hypothetical protein [Nitrosomonas nitrosa]